MNSDLSSPRQPEHDAANFNQGWREQFVVGVLRVACLLGVVFIVVLYAYLTATPKERILFTSLYVVLFAVTVFPVPYIARASALLAVTFVLGTNAILARGPWIDGSLFLLIFVVLSALLFDRQVDLFAVIVSALTLLSIAVAHLFGIYKLTNANAPVVTLADWGVYGVDFLAISAIAVVALRRFKEEFFRSAQRMQAALKTLTTERAQLEDQAREHFAELEKQTVQLRSSTAVSRTVAEAQNIDDLLDIVTRLTAEQFGYYHIGLYLLDESKKTAFLQAASSATGKQFIGQGFHIEPDRRNAFYLVIEQKQSYIASDMSAASFIHDANFPLTRSRMMLPLSIRGAIIGMLDIHSEQTQTFHAQDAEIMQTLADLAAISIDNVRLLNETKVLASQLRASTSFQARETWSKLTSHHAPAYQYTPAGVRPIFKKENKKETADGLKVPLILHGQNIGAIRLRRRGVATSWTERERVLIEKIAEQASLALENSRLVDEAQKNALRNQMITAISSRVRETLDVESVVRTATTELRKVFDLKEAEISIGSSQSEAAPAKKRGGAEDRNNFR
jgi:GAF domain-containing protein